MRDVNDMKYERGRPFSECVQDARILNARLGAARKDGREIIIINLGILGPKGGVSVRQVIFTNHTTRVSEFFAALRPELDKVMTYLIESSFSDFSLNNILSYFKGGHTSVGVLVGHWYHPDEPDTKRPNVVKWVPDSANRVFSRHEIVDNDFEEEDERDFEPVN